MKWSEIERSQTEFAKYAFQPGALDNKAKELIALSIALSIGCEDEACYRQHMKRAKQYGATDEEIAEVAALVMAMASCLIGSLANRRLGLTVGDISCCLPE